MRLRRKFSFGLLFIFISLLVSDFVWAAYENELNQFPSVAKVYVEMKGVNDMDTKAKRAAAYQILIAKRNTLREAAEISNPKLPFPSNDLQMQYTDAAFGIIQQMQKAYAKNPVTLQKWYNQVAAYRSSRSFEEQVINKFFSVQWRTSFTLASQELSRQPKKINDVPGYTPNEFVRRYDVSGYLPVMFPLFIVSVILLIVAFAREFGKFGVNKNNPNQFLAGNNKYPLEMFTGYVIGNKEFLRREGYVTAGGSFIENHSVNNIKFHLTNNVTMKEYDIQNSNLNIFDGMTLTVLHTIINNRRLYLYFKKHETGVYTLYNGTIESMIRPWRRGLIPLLYIVTFAYMMLVVNNHPIDHAPLFTNFLFLFFGTIIAFSIIRGSIKKKRMKHFMEKDFVSWQNRAEEEKNNLLLDSMISKEE